MPSGYITIGKILRPQGNKGEVRIWSEADSPEAFLSLIEKGAFLFAKGWPSPRVLPVEARRIHKGFVVLKFEGFDDITSAETLRDAFVLIPEGDRPGLSEDEFYLDQLVDLRVVEGEQGRPIGRVKDVFSLTGQTLLEVQKDEGGLFLVPFVSDIVSSVDLKQATISVSLPRGLDEL